MNRIKYGHELFVKVDRIFYIKVDYKDFFVVQHQRDH